MALKKRQKVSAEFSMSSLTDIIFLLLIFFMLTSTLVSQNALNLQLPSSSSKTVAPQSISVSIKKGGRFYLGTREVRVHRLADEIRKEIKRQKNQDKATLTILSEKDTEVQHVVKAMDIANRLGINAILATEPGN